MAAKTGMRKIGLLLTVLLLTATVGVAAEEKIGIGTHLSVDVERANHTAEETATLYCMENDLDWCIPADRDDVLRLYCIENRWDWCIEGVNPVTRLLIELGLGGVFNDLFW